MPVVLGLALSLVGITGLAATSPMADSLALQAKQTIAEIEIALR
jgi:hypothetical protein